MINQKFEYSNYFKDKNKKIINSEILTTTQIGYESERNHYWKRINKFHKHISNFESFKLEVSINIKSILSYLKIYVNKSLFYQVLLNLLRTYDKIGKFRHFKILKNKLNLSLISIYFTCKINNIFINLKDLFNHYNISLRIKNIVIKDYLSVNNDIYLFLKNKDFRMKFISNILVKYIDFEEFFPYLEQNWIIFNKAKDSVIILTLCRLLFEFKKDYKLYINKIANFLGISAGSCNNFISNNNLKISNKKWY